MSPLQLIYVVIIVLVARRGDALYTRGAFARLGMGSAPVRRRPIPAFRGGTGAGHRGPGPVTPHMIRASSAAAGGGGALVCLSRDSLVQFSRRTLPSVRILVNGIGVRRSSTCLCYSSTCFGRGEGSFVTFKGIEVRRNSALAVASHGLSCGNSAQLTCLASDIIVDGSRMALRASALACGHSARAKFCAYNNLLHSSAGALASGRNCCCASAGLTRFGFSIMIRDGSSTAVLDSALACSARAGVTAVLNPAAVGRGSRAGVCARLN